MAGSGQRRRCRFGSSLCAPIALLPGADLPSVGARCIRLRMPKTRSNRPSLARPPGTLPERVSHDRVPGRQPARRRADMTNGNLGDAACAGIGRLQSAVCGLQWPGLHRRRQSMHELRSWAVSPPARCPRSRSRRPTPEYRARTVMVASEGIRLATASLCSCRPGFATLLRGELLRRPILVGPG